MDNSKVLIGGFNKNSVEVIQVHLVRRDDMDLLDIRTWISQEGKDFIPTKKGICIKIEQIDSLMNLMIKASQEIERKELIVGVDKIDGPHPDQTGSGAQAMAEKKAVEKVEDGKSL